jgi:tRNA wybutosine-synthesizing protein 3
MVGVRSTGLALDSVIGWLGPDGEGVCIVDNHYLQGLIAVANQRFVENKRRICRFRDLLLGKEQRLFDMESTKKSKNDDWEDAAVRRERKRAEGLKRSEELRQAKNEGNV